LGPAGLAHPRDAVPELPPGARRHPGDPAGAALRGTASARVESTSVTAMSRKTVIGAALVFITLPAALALTEAVSFYVRNRTNGTIVSSGEKRTYLFHVPRTYNRTRPTPLVISMHGAGGWPVQQMELS